METKDTGQEIKDERLTFPFNFKSDLSDGHIRITPEAASIKSILYELVRQTMAVTQITGVAGHRLHGGLPGEKPITPIGDEEISKLFAKNDVDFSEDGRTVVSYVDCIVPTAVWRRGGNRVSRINVVSSDQLKFSIDMERDGTVLFNERLFDMNHGQTSVNVVRMTLLALQTKALPTR